VIGAKQDGVLQTTPVGVTSWFYTQYKALLHRTVLNEEAGATHFLMTWCKPFPAGVAFPAGNDEGLAGFESDFIRHL
jgi:hypothetical protein